MGIDVLGPLTFAPLVRSAIWGGRRLGEELGKRLPSDEPYGEAWDLSSHPAMTTRVVGGPLEGWPLDRVWREQYHALTGHTGTPGPFPLLLKWLDCRDWLSVQVHPSDDVAGRLLGDPFGKTEAWFILDAGPDGRVYAGLKAGVGPGELRAALANGTVADCLHQFRPAPGDCLYLRAGTVHAVGGGVLMAEVQQSSDATFRLFDWNRPGADGQPRPLHIEESFASIDWQAGPVDPVVPQSLSFGGNLRETLVEGTYFQVERWTLAGGRLSNPAEGRLSLVMVVRGQARLAWPGGEEVVTRGETRVIPACCAAVSWEGSADTQLLVTTLPD
jgi:mannose-6-phosphate isomerase